MILFTILTLILTILLITVITAIAIGGAGFIIIFGDVIVCIFIIVSILKLLLNRKKNK